MGDVNGEEHCQRDVCSQLASLWAHPPASGTGSELRSVRCRDLEIGRFVWTLRLTNSRGQSPEP